MQKVPFEEIAQELDRYFQHLGYKPNEIKKDFFPGCRKAYDILLQLEPEETDRQVQFCLDLERADRYKGTEIYMYLYEDNFETCPWPINLGKEIVLDEGGKLSDAEIATHYLFHIPSMDLHPSKLNGSCLASKSSPKKP